MIHAIKKFLGLSKFALVENVEIVHRSASGAVKKVFQPYYWAGMIIKHLGIQLPQIQFLFGYWSNSLRFQNLVTNAGFAGVASRINGSGAEAAFVYLALGTGATAAAATDTTLQTEITDTGLARASATASRVTTTQTNDTAQLVYTWTATGAKAVTEAGVLNAASVGVLLARQVFSAINTANTDTIQVTYRVKAS